MTAPSPAEGETGGERERSLSRRAVRHTGWNLLGVLLPFAVGLFAIPVLTRELGPARFGVLGLAWMLLEYFSLFDAGLGRATIRAVAGEREVLQRDGVAARTTPAALTLSATVTAAVTIQVLLGAIAGLLFAAFAPVIVDRLLKVPPAIAAESVLAMRVLAMTVPLLMFGLALRGLLEAAERFDLSNAIRMPVSAGTFIVPALMAVAGGDLPELLLALLVLRAAGTAAQFIAVRRALPALRWRRPREWRALRELLAFGGWVAVSNVVSPLLIYFDRIVVGALLGVVALGYYTAPFEASLRLLVIPAALVTTLYPMASALISSGDMDGMRRLYAGAVRALVVALIGITAVGVVLAPDLLQLWLGAEYAGRSSVALQILCIGVFVNAIGHVPFAFLQAAGRPELMARFHILELALHIPLTFWMVGRFGIAGAAIAWTLRALLDAGLVFAAAKRVLGVGIARLADGRMLGVAAILGVLLPSLWILRVAAAGTDANVHRWLILMGAIALSALQALAAWRLLLRADEREAILLAVRRRTGSVSEAAVAAAQPARTAR